MKTPQLPEVNWCELYGKLTEAVDHAGLNIEGAGSGYFVLTPKAEPVPYQWNRGQLIGVLMFAYGSIMPPETARTFAEAVIDALDNNEVVRALINHLRENPE